MLEVRNLVKRYKISKKSKTKDVVALNNVSITFPDKGLIFLLGKSGSGKSTLLNAIGGLDSFDEGEIIIKGKSSKDFSQSDFDSYRNTFIGFIFQEYNVLEEFTVAKNLSLAIELQGKNASKEAVNELLEMVEMQDFAKRKPNQLSGGQKQRVAIARALIKNPEIIMADEPTGALDSNTGKQVMETLKKLSQEKLVIIVSHDREFAEIYGDRIIELKDGKIKSDVTKKEVEPTKTESGISIINDEIIHIKKGQKFTKEEVENIVNRILENSKSNDTIISLSDTANDDIKKANSITDDGNMEVFQSTEPEDVVVKNYQAHDFKLIKSKLKFKDSFKMGASALKNKVGKLVFTIMLSFIAFAMFGVIDTLSTFNRAGAIFHTVEQFNKKTVSIMKETEGEWSNNVIPFKETDVKAIKEKFPDIELKKVVGANIEFGHSYWGGNTYSRGLQIDGLNTSSSNPAQLPFMSGMMHVTADEMTKFNLTLLPGGRMPTADNEIAISKHIFDCFKALNSTVELTEEKMLNEYNKCYTYYNYDKYTIVGIVDDGSDYSEYMSMESSQINSDYMLQQKISRELEFGFTNMIYITEDHYDRLLSEPINMNLQVQYTDVENMGSYSFNASEITNMAKLYDEERTRSINRFADDYGFYYSKSTNNSILNNNEFVTLADNEVILYYNYFNQLFDTETEEERKALLNSTTPLTFTLESYYSEPFWNEETETQEANEVQTVLATYTVVGYHTSGRDIYANETTIAQHYNIIANNNSHGEQFYIIHGPNQCETNLGDSKTINKEYSDSYYGQTKEEFLEYRISYYKNNGTLLDSQGNFIELHDNEIIVQSYMLSNIAQGEELQRKIDEGLTISFSTDYEGKDIVFTGKVVGLIDGYSNLFASNSAINDTFKPLLSGFDYSIALLSEDSRTNENFINYCETFNDDNIKYTVQTGSTPILDQFGDTLKSVAEVLLYVGIGFAVFASLLLMNFISTSISYKKREIGILRALGARGSDVFGIFFNESSVIALINFTLATIATLVTCGILNNVIITKLGLDLVLLSVGIRQIALMLGVSMLTAFIASLLPVMKIARKKPIDAINNR